MKICHNCGFELEDSIVNCLRCNEEQFENAQIFKSKPVAPPNVTPTQQRANTPPVTQPPAEQAQPVEQAQQPVQQPAQQVPQPVEQAQQPVVQPPTQQIPQPVVEQVDSIVAEDVNSSKNDNKKKKKKAKKEKEENIEDNLEPKKKNDTLLLLLVLVLLFLVITIINPYLDQALNPTSPTPTNNQPIIISPPAENGVTNQVGQNNSLENTESSYNNSNLDVPYDRFPEADTVGRSVDVLKNLYEFESNESIGATKITLKNSRNFNDIKYQVSAISNNDSMIESVLYTSILVGNTDSFELISSSILSVVEIYDLFMSVGLNLPLGQEVLDNNVFELSQLESDFAGNSNDNNANYKAIFSLNGIMAEIDVIYTASDDSIVIMNSINFSSNDFDGTEMLVGVPFEMPMEVSMAEQLA